MSNELNSSSWIILSLDDDTYLAKYDPPSLIGSTTLRVKGSVGDPLLAVRFRKTELLRLMPSILKTFPKAKIKLITVEYKVLNA